MSNEENYVCQKCGHVLAKKDAAISGYDSQSSMRHIHCPKYGKIITRNP